MSDAITVNKDQQTVQEPAGLQEMMDAGVFYGRKKSKTHPRMRPYILNNRNGIEIINLYKTLEGLEVAQEFLNAKLKGGGSVIMVATQPSFEDIVLKTAQELSIPFVNRRWLGGTLTNFAIISSRIEYFKKLKRDMAAGVFEKYTKKERVRIDHEIERLQELLGGLEHLSRPPDVIVVVDPNVHMTVMREARQLKIPVIALSNVDCDPNLIEYLIPGNTKSRQSVQWFLDTAAEMIKKAKLAAAPPTAEPVQPISQSL